MAKNIFKFSEIDDKRMLLGCSYGLIELDKESGEMKYLLNEYYVKDIIIENDDYWIATSGNGIIRYNPVNKETDVFTMKSGLP